MSLTAVGESSLHVLSILLIHPCLSLAVTRQVTFPCMSLLTVDCSFQNYGSVRLTPYSACSASFFSQNSVFQPVSAKFQTSERGHCMDLWCLSSNGGFQLHTLTFNYSISRFQLLLVPLLVRIEKCRSSKRSDTV